MPTFKNISGGPLDLPGLDLHIPAGGTFDTDDAAAEGFRFQFLIWEESTTTAAPAAVVSPVAPTVTTPAAVAPTDTTTAVTNNGAI